MTPWIIIKASINFGKQKARHSMDLHVIYFVCSNASFFILLSCWLRSPCFSFMFLYSARLWSHWAAEQIWWRISWLYKQAKYFGYLALLLKSLETEDKSCVVAVIVVFKLFVNGRLENVNCIFPNEKMDNFSYCCPAAFPQQSLIYQINLLTRSYLLQRKVPKFICKWVANYCKVVYWHEIFTGVNIFF